MDTIIKIPFSKIGEELFQESDKEEKYKKLDPYDLEEKKKDFIKAQRYDFLLILRILGVDTEIFKHPDRNEYSLPESQKGSIKKLLSFRSGKTIQAFRKFYSDLKSFDLEKQLTNEEINFLRERYKTESKKFDLSELEAIVDLVALILKDGTTPLQYNHYAEKMYNLTRVHLTQATKMIEQELVPFVTEKIDRLFPILKNYSLNDADKVELLRFYKDLIVKINHDFNSIVNIADDIRSSEINAISEKEIEDWDKSLSSIEDILEQAREQYREEKEERKHQLKWSEKQIQEIDEFINSRPANNKTNMNSNKYKFKPERYKLSTYQDKLR
ncbi:hypothetical protein [Paenibacillus polymyxa]|uniref:hypothetical protein n=1 Tax=Paenibacillus polymyxa TaxID=1406 RepID=UPI002379BD68|nr:hypothetical protein [Paenibacillus polymyxa]WDM22279.1 hypothetical protein J4I02_00995 [Paenibacillus polymyxa]